MWRPEKGHGKHQRQTRAPGVVQAVKRRQADLAAHRISVPEPPAQLCFPQLAVRAGQPLLRCSAVSMAGRLGGPGARVVLVGQEPPAWPARMLAHELYRSHVHRLLVAGSHREEDLVPLGATGLPDPEALLGTAAAVVVAIHDLQMLQDLGTWPRWEAGGGAGRPASWLA